METVICNRATCKGAMIVHDGCIAYYSHNMNQIFIMTQARRQIVACTVKTHVRLLLSIDRGILYTQMTSTGYNIYLMIYTDVEPQLFFSMSMSNQLLDMCVSPAGDRVIIITYDNIYIYDVNGVLMTVIKCKGHSLVNTMSNGDVSVFHNSILYIYDSNGTVKSSMFTSHLTEILLLFNGKFATKYNDIICIWDVMNSSSSYIRALSDDEGALIQLHDGRVATFDTDKIQIFHLDGRLDAIVTLAHKSNNIYQLYDGKIITLGDKMVSTYSLNGDLLFKHECQYSIVNVISVERNVITYESNVHIVSLTIPHMIPAFKKTERLSDMSVCFI